MKIRVTALAAALALLLTGCSGLLVRTYSQVTPHNNTPVTTGNSSVLRVESYQELVNALLYLINQGVETGTVQMYNYPGDPEEDLSVACLEVAQEAALGAYAVDYIKYDLTTVVASYEARISITYRRTHQQVSAIVAATGPSAIRSELQEVLSVFGSEIALRISYFNEDEDYILRLVRQAYYATPGSALGMPQVEVAIYPDTGTERIVELLLTYDMDKSALERRKNDLDARADTITQNLQNLTGEEALQALAEAVMTPGGYQPDRGSTPWDALMGQGADSQGLSLAMSLLCQKMDIPASVVEGTLAGEAHLWNIVSTPNGYRHLDLSGWTGKLALYTDREMESMGYVWDTDLTPRCVDETAF